MSCSKAISRWLLFFLFIATCGLPRATVAQSGTAGSLTGVIQDASGAVMPRVSVTAKNLGTGLNRTVTSDEEGLDDTGFASRNLSSDLRNQGFRS
jgi:hypothetical protein